MKKDPHKNDMKLCKKIYIRKAICRALAENAERVQ